MSVIDNSVELDFLWKQVLSLKPSTLSPEWVTRSRELFIAHVAHRPFVLIDLQFCQFHAIACNKIGIHRQLIESNRPVRSINQRIPRETDSSMIPVISSTAGSAASAT